MTKQSLKMLGMCMPREDVMTGRRTFAWLNSPTWLNKVIVLVDSVDMLREGDNRMRVGAVVVKGVMEGWCFLWVEQRVFIQF